MICNCRYYFTVIILVLCMILAGCSDNPQAKATKEARQKIAEATKMVELYKIGEQIDYEAAQKVLKSAFSQASKADGNVDMLYIISGDLSFAHGQKLSDQLPGYEKNAIDSIEKSGLEILNLINLQAEYEIHEILQRVSLDEADTLEEVAQGSDSENGIKERLSESRAQLTALQEELERYRTMASEAQNKADAIQAEADELLRQAELSKGDKKLSLEKQAYSLIKGYTDASGELHSGKIHYSAKVQHAIDMANIVNQKIAIVEPLVMKLESDLEMVTKRADELKDQDKRLQHMKHLAALDGQMTEKKELLTEIIEELNSNLQAYDAQVQQISETIESAASDYSKVRDRDHKAISDVEKSECYNELAKLNISGYLFNSRISSFATSFAELDEGEYAQKLQVIADERAKLAQESLESISSRYDEAIETLEIVMDRNRSGELAERAVRSYLLIVNDRLKYAQLASDQAKVDELLDKVEEYKEIAVNADPYFSRTLVAKLYIPYGVEFKTEEEMLLEKYEGLQSDFNSAASLDKEARFERLQTLLTQLDELSKPRDMKVYDNLVKNIWDSYKEDWTEIKKANSELSALAVFSSYWEVGEEEGYGTADYDDGGATPRDQFGDGGGNDPNF